MTVARTVEQNGTEADSVDAVDLRIAQLLIEKPTVTDQELADHLGISRQTVNRRRNSDPVRTRLIEVLSISEKRIRRITSKALARLEESLDDPDPKIRFAAAVALSRNAIALMFHQPAVKEIGVIELSSDARKEWLKDAT